MSPEYPGVFGRVFCMCPLANVKRSRHPFLNRQERRSSSSGLVDLIGQTFVSHLTSVKASSEAFTVNPVAILAMSDRRVAPHKCHGRGKHSEFRHRRNFIDLEQLGIRFHALRGRVPVRLNLTGLRRALLHIQSGEALNGNENHPPPWPPGQTCNRCACCSSSRHPTQPPTRARHRGRTWPVALGADHQGRPGEGRRAPRSDLSHHALRTDKDRPIPCAGSSSWSSRLVLAGRRCPPLYRRNGSWCPMRRGKPAPGMKASRALRRQKRTWRRTK